MRRREFLKYSALGALAGASAGCGQPVRWQRDAFRRKDSSRVAILPASRYDEPLKDIIVRGIKLCGVNVKGKRILLKPNLVEFDPKGVINTQPGGHRSGHRFIAQPGRGAGSGRRRPRTPSR